MEVSDGIIEITAAGSYELTGVFNGQILVNADDEDDVQLILNGVEVTNDEDAPIFIQQSDEAVITLKTGSINTITDTSAYMEETDDAEEERTNGAIYSKEDLAINGEGALIISSTNKSGILGKDDVLILREISPSMPAETVSEARTSCTSPAENSPSTQAPTDWIRKLSYISMVET